ncbi:hypothetical protein FKM82_010327 [Ascaphus truei]
MGFGRDDTSCYKTSIIYTYHFIGLSMTTPDAMSKHTGKSWEHRPISSCIGISQRREGRKKQSSLFNVCLIECFQPRWFDENLKNSYF